MNLRSTYAGLITAACLLAVGAPSLVDAQPAPPAKPTKQNPTDYAPGLRAEDLNNHVMVGKGSGLVEPRAQDWRTPNPDNLLVIDTNKGRVVVELAPMIAPASVERIKTLAHQHFYDGLTFFRVIDNFMDQTGDPKNTGEGGSTLPNVKAEFTFRRGPTPDFVPVPEAGVAQSGFINTTPVASQTDAMMALTADGKVAAWGEFCSGVVGMARAGDPDSANSQFYVMRHDYPKLNKQYTVFGRVVDGLSVVRAIKVGEPPEDPQDRMVTVRLASDLPPSDRPVVAVLDANSPAFKSRVEQARIDKGDEFTLCDVDIPTKPH
ncbi:MAG: peptidylprolyl isomerase [Caulobacteraceae bacterium]